MKKEKYGRECRRAPLPYFSFYHAVWLLHAASDQTAGNSDLARQSFSTGWNPDLKTFSIYWKYLEKNNVVGSLLGNKYMYKLKKMYNEKTEINV